MVRPKHRWEDITRMDFEEIGINTRIGIIGEPVERGIEPPGSISHGVS